MNWYFAYKFGHEYYQMTVIIIAIFIAVVIANARRQDIIG